MRVIICASPSSLYSTSPVAFCSGEWEVVENTKGALRAEKLLRKSQQLVSCLERGRYKCDILPIFQISASAIHVFLSESTAIIWPLQLSLLALSALVSVVHGEEEIIVAKNGLTIAPKINSSKSASMPAAEVNKLKERLLLKKERLVYDLCRYRFLLLRRLHHPSFSKTKRQVRKFLFVYKEGIEFDTWIQR